MISTGRDTYMTIWSVEEKDGKYKGRASTSRKNKQTNEYQNSNWNVRFVGAAADKAKNLVEKDRIVIKTGDLSIENINWFSCILLGFVLIGYLVEILKK